MRQNYLTSQEIQSQEESIVKARQTSKNSKEQYLSKHEMIGKMIPLLRGQTIFHNLPYNTGKTKRKVAVENIREGFEESRLINSSSFHT